MGPSRGLQVKSAVGPQVLSGGESESKTRAENRKTCRSAEWKFFSGGRPEIQPCAKPEVVSGVGPKVGYGVGQEVGSGVGPETVSSIGPESQVWRSSGRAGRTKLEVESVGGPEMQTRAEDRKSSSPSSTGRSAAAAARRQSTRLAVRWPATARCRRAAHTVSAARTTLE